MSDVLNQGITVTLGGHEYTIRALPIDKDLEWRKAVGKFFASVARTMDTKEPHELLARAGELVAGEGMDDIINSMFLLEGWEGLDITQVTRVEIMRAAAEVYKAYYAPFVESLTELAIALA